ncbi:MAG: ribosome-associated translation inhibitor RaiA [Candidatus Auribacterota bacterium]|nr:ribosome-associated translation inhibitor RaiA [Candidatus Auribacterota bacterium]
MSITITARHTSITEENKEYARSKVENLDDLWDANEVAHLTIDSERNGYLLELNLQAGHHYINCRSKNRNLQTAINQVVKKFEKQLKKHKEKLSRRHTEKIQVPYSPEDIPADIPRLIKVSDFEVPRLGEREASLRMRENNHQFILYTGQDTGKLSIIYRREDGDLGLIEIGDKYL